MPSASLPMRQTPRRSTSGMAVETTGKPAARYSRTLSGFAASVSSLTLKGISATSNAFAYRGRSAYGLRPSTRMFRAPSSGLRSAVELPSSTTVPPENASATWRMSCRSTQSAISPQKPMIGPGAFFRSSGIEVAASKALPKCSRSTPCCTRCALGFTRALSARSFSEEQITTSLFSIRRRSSSRISSAGASLKALNSSTQW